MDVFVCGEALWISCGTWIAFWNGGIGAFVAAVLGGAVALVVVRLTNAQQRHGVDRTIEVAAVADFVAAIQELEWSATYRMDEPLNFDAGSYVLHMRASLTRLLMARAESRSAAQVLMHWPERMHNLVSLYRLALLKSEPHAHEVELAIAEASTSATLSLPYCLSRSRQEREVGMTSLKDANRELKAATDRFDGLRNKSVPVASQTTKIGAADQSP